MAGAIRYCAATDGVRIAYSVQGDGPTLVECNGFWNSFVTENPWSRDAWAPIRADRSLIRFDARGVGLSERDPLEISHDLMISDLECVTAAAGADKFALWGGGVSVPSAIEFAVRHPERVQLLVLSRGVVRAADIMPRANLVSLLQLIETDWALASRLFADMDTREAVPDYGVPVAVEISATSMRPPPGGGWRDCTIQRTLRASCRSSRHPRSCCTALRIPCFRSPEHRRWRRAFQMRDSSRPPGRVICFLGTTSSNPLRQSWAS